MDLHSAISPIDGRYSSKTSELRSFFSEAAFIRYRALVEIEYLISLSLLKETSLEVLDKAAQTKLRAIYAVENMDSLVSSVKKYEREINHDVKAIEYVIKDELDKASLSEIKEWVHFALTSEDVNNNAYALMISEAVSQILLVKLEQLQSSIAALASKYSALPILARTHGQAASPTTLGKEIKVFSVRLAKQIENLKSLKISAKLNGATGNYNAHFAAYPEIEWVSFSRDFVAHLGLLSKSQIKLEANLHTTQVESGDSYAELFDNLARINNILLDLSQDFWRYISDQYLSQKPKDSEVGSSTMPHKVNPIDFENAEGNLGLANSLFDFFSKKLPISRLQRDLSDSTVKRNFGVAFGHSLLAYESLITGLSKLSANESVINQQLLEHPEILGEAIQTILRRENQTVPYEQLKALTRGKAIDQKSLEDFIDTLSITAELKSELKSIKLHNYIGLATQLTES